MILNLYDPDRRCPKCGGYANVKHERSPFRGYDMLRLIRRCERCDYFWRELPLDIKEESARAIVESEGADSK